MLIARQCCVRNTMRIQHSEFQSLGYNLFMPSTENQVAEWEHAYRVLGVPVSASPRIIKVSWHRLIKQWRPGHCPGGMEEQAEATRMTEILNAAYSSIQSAPLLQHANADPAYSPRDLSSAPGRENAPQMFHWYSFWLRFACGALFGALVSFRMLLYAYENPPVMILGVATTILFFAFASGFVGEKFWSLVKGH